MEKTALKAFRVFLVEECEDYDKAIAALKARFRSVDIEELRGLEFHHKIQGPSESVEELGLELQRLGHKAFPTVQGRELDRLLKGRFFQALHVRWQRKIGAPKMDETFQELYDRARMFEQREKQYAESAASRVDGDRVKGNDKPSKQKSSERSHKKSAQSTSENGKATANSANPPQNTRVCYTCQQPGHLARVPTTEQASRGSWT